MINDLLEDVAKIKTLRKGFWNTLKAWSHNKYHKESREDSAASNKNVSGHYDPGSHNIS